MFKLGKYLWRSEKKRPKKDRGSISLFPFFEWQYTDDKPNVIREKR
jgi:hypothetical protein